MDASSFEPILALRNSLPYNCFEVDKKNKRDEIKDCGQFKYLLDYTKRILKWHQRAISRPEVSRYKDLPYLELPNYLVQYYQITEFMGDKNYSLREAQKSIRLQYLSIKPPKKTSQYFDKRDAEFKYETYVTNYRQKKAKDLKHVSTEEEVKTVDDNQFLLHHRACQIWAYIQKQAQAAGDVRVTRQNVADPLEMFPISGFSEILVDSPPLPVLPRYDRVVSDIEAFKQVLRDKGKERSIEQSEGDMVVTPSMRHVVFGDPPKWRRISRILQNEQVYP